MQSALMSHFKLLRELGRQGPRLDLANTMIGVDCPDSAVEHSEELPGSTYFESFAPAF